MRPEVAFLSLLLPLALSNYCNTGGSLSTDKNSCFFLNFDRGNFDEVEAICGSRYGGHLASIHNGFDNRMLSDYLSPYIQDVDGFWIGATLRNATMTFNAWTWTDGTMMNYASYAADQPNPKGQCMKHELKYAAWQFEDCNTVLPFVCSTPSFPGSTMMMPKQASRLHFQ